MKHLIPILLAALVAGCSPKSDGTNSSPDTSAEQAKEYYGLDERCGKRAEERFDKGWSGTPTADYVSHYNKKLNKCFFIVHNSLVSKGAIYHSASLSDVNENKEYGDYDDITDTADIRHPVVTDCAVQGHTCKTRAEWDSLAQPFMTE